MSWWNPVGLSKTHTAARYIVLSIHELEHRLRGTSYGVQIFSGSSFILSYFMLSLIALLPAPNIYLSIYISKKGLFLMPGAAIRLPLS